jgi:hypothetical protein
MVLGYRSISCSCESSSCSHGSRLPTLDKRDENAQAKRIARDLDRGPHLCPPLAPSLGPSMVKSHLGCVKAGKKQRRGRETAHGMWDLRWHKQTC